MLPDLSPLPSDCLIMKPNSRVNTFIFLFLFNTLLSYTQHVVVRGTGEGYAGVPLTVSLRSDPVTGKQIPLFIVNCNENGEFTTEIPLKGMEMVYLKAGIANFALLAAEGHEYNLRLSPYQPVPEEYENNPFFTGKTIIPEVVNDTSDINNLIRRFDALYNTVFNRVADRVAKKISREEIPSLISRLNSFTASTSDQFFNDFVTFRLIMLNAAAWGEYPGRREDSILINRIFVPENPAYTDLIEMLYRDSFRQLMTGPFKNEFLRALNISSPAAIMKVLEHDGKVVNPELQQYIILLNSYYGYHNGLFEEKMVCALLDSLAFGGKTGYIRKLASVLKSDITALTPGSVPPYFELPDSTGRKISPGEFAGKYLLLVFIKSADYNALSELTLLKSWAGKYSSDMIPVAVLAGKNFSEMLSFFRQRGFDWIFLDGSGSPFLAANYDIKLWPAFFLLNREGKIAVKYCPAPSENLESLISGIITRESEQSGR